MKWMRHKALSEADMDWLVGSPLMEILQRTRLVLVYDPNDRHASMEEMGLTKCEGVFFIRALQDRNDTYEILFESEADREMIEQTLTQFKLSGD